MNEQERPTALIRRIDVSASGQRASGAPAFTEDVLLHGYLGTSASLATVPCSCGGEVTADPSRPAYGVAAHQYTSRHRAWRAAREN